MCFPPSAFSKESPISIEAHEIAEGFRPSIAVDNKGYLHAAFIRENKNCDLRRDPKPPDICYSGSIDGGKTWTPPIVIPRIPARSLGMLTPGARIATETSGAIDIVWSDVVFGQSDIFFTRSNDNGRTWSEPANISRTKGNSITPALATGSNSEIHVAWQETIEGSRNADIYYSYSTDGGKTWGKDQSFQIENVSDSQSFSASPQIIIDSKGSVHLVWLGGVSNQTNLSIYYAKRSNIWTKPVKINKSLSLVNFPRITVGQKDTIYIVWSDTDNFTTENKTNIRCAINSNATDFSEPINISDTADFYSQPTAAADRNSHIIIAWSRTHSIKDAPGLYAKISDDSGKNFSAVINLFKGNSIFPDAVILKDKIAIIFQKDLLQTNYGTKSSVDIVIVPNTN